MIGIPSPLHETRSLKRYGICQLRSQLAQGPLLWCCCRCRAIAIAAGNGDICHPKKHCRLTSNSPPAFSDLQCFFFEHLLKPPSCQKARESKALRLATGRHLAVVRKQCHLNGAKPDTLTRAHPGDPVPCNGMPSWLAACSWPRSSRLCVLIVSTLRVVVLCSTDSLPPHQG